MDIDQVTTALFSPALRYACSSLSGFTRTRSRLNLDQGNTITPNSTVVLTLPALNLLDLDSLDLFGDVTATSSTTVSSTVSAVSLLPKWGMNSLIDTLWWTAAVFSSAQLLVTTTLSTRY